MEAIEFSNPYFCRAQPHLLRRIKRKDTSKPSANQKATQNQVQELMIRLQEHQEETFTRFERITDENEGNQPFNFDLIYFLPNSPYFKNMLYSKSKFTFMFKIKDQKILFKLNRIFKFKIKK